MKEENINNWYKDWFDENYLLLYNHRDNADALKQARLIVETLKPQKDAAILDLACGNGRHCRIFRDMGFNITGLDLSKSLIENGLSNDSELSLIIGDMRNIPGRYDLILSLFTSFGYFADDADNEKVISSVSGALNPGGRFWLDFLNPASVIDNLVPVSEKTLGEGIEVVESRSIENGTVHKVIKFTKGDIAKTYHERVKLYKRENLESFFNRNGIVVSGVFGNYSGNNWTEKSERTIIYGIKK